MTILVTLHCGISPYLCLPHMWDQADTVFRVAADERRLVALHLARYLGCAIQRDHCEVHDDSSPLVRPMAQVWAQDVYG